MIQAPMNPAETLLNYIVHHTDLYMRRKKGVSENELWHKAFKALSPWLAEFRKKAVKETAEAIAERLDNCALGAGLLKDIVSQATADAYTHAANLAREEGET